MVSNQEMQIIKNLVKKLEADQVITCSVAREFYDEDIEEACLAGFRASEKIYLEKITALKEKLGLARGVIKIVYSQQLNSYGIDNRAFSLMEEWLRQNERKE